MEFSKLTCPYLEPCSDIGKGELGGSKAEAFRAAGPGMLEKN